MGFGSIEDFASGNFKTFILFIAGLLVFLGIVALTVFFVAIHGEEQVMVPDVVGKDLTQALMEMQVKELYPRIHLRYSQTSLDKGRVLEQEPRPGTISKAGRRVRLVVSQGVVLNRIENFVGRNVEEVRMEFQTIYASSETGTLLSIREPVMYEFSSENPGTILAQKPEPGVNISGPTAMEFVVSRGRENSTITVPQLTGLEFARALDIISSSGLNYHFKLSERRDDERPETIVLQTPPAGTTIGLNTVVELTLTNPTTFANNEIFGIFRYNIPQIPYPLNVRLDALLPSGERTRVFAVDYMGGEFTVPYKLPENAVLILTMLNRELHRETVGN